MYGLLFKYHSNNLKYTKFSFYPMIIKRIQPLHRFSISVPFKRNFDECEQSIGTIIKYKVAVNTRI